MRRAFWVVACAVIAAVVAAGARPTVRAVPPEFADELVVTTPFDSPTAVKVLPGGQLLVLEKAGDVHLVRTDGSLVSAGRFDVCTEGERGLLSIALDPGFATNGVLYVYLTARTPSGGCQNTLLRTTMSGESVSTAGGQVLVDNIVSSDWAHNGGSVEVGRDGHLYLSVGENGVRAYSRDMSSLNGKVLRVTTSGAPAPGNPFLTTAGHGPCAGIGQSAQVCEEIYALGLRNPFRMAFDPNSTATRFRINDVGGGTREEVNDGVAGADYGWDACEGPCDPPNATYTDPVTSYARVRGRFIVGGAFIPNGWWGAAYDGAYLFADGATNVMWLLPSSAPTNYAVPFTNTNLSVAVDIAFGTRHGQRALFYINHGNGELRKIVGPNAATTGAAGPAYLGGPSEEPPPPPTTTTPTTTPGTTTTTSGTTTTTSAPGTTTTTTTTTPAPTPPGNTPTPAAHVFTAYPSAARVFDSRNGVGGPVGKVAGGQVRTVPLGVPAGATAALVNMTLDNATPNPEEQCAPGSYLVAWQPGTAMPSTSNANVGSCDVAANVGVLAVDAAGATNIQVYADTHVILDVLGYYTASPMAVSAGRFEAITPSRLLDTRAAAGTGNPYTRADTGNESVVRFPVVGRNGVPADAKTVSLTVTAIGPGSDAGGFVTAYAGGTAQPPTSTVNHAGNGDTRANLALVPVGADGTVELYLYQVANVVVDVGGWITSASDPADTDGRLRLANPARIADSRNGLGVSPLTPGGQVVLEPAGVPTDASAIVQNVTMVSHAPGWICATPNPWAGGDVSIQNARMAGQDRPAMTFTTLGSTAGQPRLRYCSQDNADLIVDVFGWFE